MPIRWRLTLFIALVIGAILLALGLALYLSSRNALFADTESTVHQRAESAARAVESGQRLDDSYVEQLTLDGVSLIVRGEEGRVLRQINLAAGGEIGGDAVWREAAGSGRAASGTVALLGDDTYYVRAVPVEPPGGPARVVEAAKSYEPALETLEILGSTIAVCTGAALLLSAGGAYLLARAALAPIAAVTTAAQEIGEQDLSRRLSVANPKDEVGRLTATINALLARLEAAFIRREEALERQRSFAADASHELRTPLTAIGGHARMLDEWALAEDPQRARRSVRAIRREAGRMRNLVESLLTLTRGDESGKLGIARHDLAAVAGEAVQEAAYAADAGVSVEYASPGREIEALFDRDRVLQISSILLENAVKYTPEGGRVVVRLREEGDMAALEVSDTGVGISEEELPLVFERFHRGDPSRSDGGAGLGLSIARQLAEAHGGGIRAASVPGEGSTFTLLLPRPDSA